MAAYIKIITSIIAGLLLSLYISQNQLFFKTIIANHIQNLPAFKDATVDYKIDYLNIFSPNLKLKNIIVKDKNNRWHWQCKSIRIRTSWLHFIFFQKLKINIKINKFYGSSLAENSVEIIDHLKKFLEQKVIFPVEIEEITSKQSKLDIIFISKFSSHPSIQPSLKLRRTGKRAAAPASHEASPGSVMVPVQRNFSEVGSNVEPYERFHKNSIKKLDNKLKIEFNSQSREINKTLKNNFYISDGYLKIDNKKEITNLNGMIHITLPQNRSKRYLNLNCTFHAPLLKTKRCFASGIINNDGSKFKINNINGDIIIDPIKINKNSIYAYLKFPLKHLKRFIDKKYHKLLKANLCSVKLFCDSDLSKFNGQILIENRDSQKLFEKIKIDFNKNRYLTGKIDIFSKYSNLSGKFKFNDKFAGNINLYNQDQINIGKFKLEPKQLNIKANLNGLSNIKLEDINIVDNQKEILKINFKDSTKLCSTIDYQLIKNILPDPFNEMLSGSGELIFENGKLHLQNGNIFLPNIYNIIKEFDCDLKIKNNNIIVKNLKISLYKGEISCKRGTITLDNFDSGPKFVHLPLTFKNLFFNFMKEVISTISGNLLFEKSLDKDFECSGNIIIDRSSIKLSKIDTSQKVIPENNIALNISLITKQPIKLKSSQLECKSLGNIQIKKNGSELQVNGNLKILNGELKFPYKNLNITQGEIYLVPSNQLIELSAKNTIKGHAITAHIEGPIKKPNIILESHPQLTDEEIGSLLITGSQNASLNILAPSIIVQNLQNILIESNDKSKEILKPLKHIRLISNLNDQNSIAGITGGVEIDFNERLHATIQKDLTTSDEAKLEIDYQLTDDINIRGTKDENGDLSGELEMRWRF